MAIVRTNTNVEKKNPGTLKSHSHTLQPNTHRHDYTDRRKTKRKYFSYEARMLKRSKKNALFPEIQL